LLASGVLDVPLAKIISTKIALQELFERRKEDLEAMAAEPYMADTNWKMVEENTTFEEQDFGGLQSDKVTSTWVCLC
jgi:hypothetical protein